MAIQQNDAMSPFLFFIDHHFNGRRIKKNGIFFVSRLNNKLFNHFQHSLDIIIHIAIAFIYNLLYNFQFLIIRAAKSFNKKYNKRNTDTKLLHFDTDIA